MDWFVGVVFVGIPLAIALFATLWLSMGGAWGKPRDFVGEEPDPNERAKALLEQDYESGRIDLAEYERRRDALARRD